jgi:hypothetical protein
MTNTEDVHGIVLHREQDAIVSEAEPERTSHVTVKRRDSPATRARKMKNALEDTHGGGLIQGAYVAPCFIEPLNPIRRHLLRVF